MNEEARYVTKFFFDEEMPVKAIIDRLKEHYGENAISPFTVHCWVKQVKLRRKGLSSIPAPRRECDDEIVDTITDRLAENLLLSGKKMLEPWALREVQ
jgi:hypothetical protein